MANTKREKLFAEFPPVPTEKWEEVIAVDLKGADYERKLVWRTPEGFNVRPYYRAENLEGLKFLASEPGEFPYVRGTRCDNVWRVHQSLTVKCPEAANAEALKLLDSGVDSLGFLLTKGLSAAEVETLLRDIHLPAVEVVFFGRRRRGRRGTRIGEDRKGGLAEDRFRALRARSDHQPSVAHRRVLLARRGEVLQDAGRSGAPYGRDEGRARGDGVGRELFERRFDHRRRAGLHPFRPATNTSCG